MKISSVLVHVLQAPLSDTFRWSFDQTSSRSACIVEIRTDSGLQGWSECFGPAHLNAPIVQHLARRVVGEDPLETDRIWQTLYTGTRDQGRKGLFMTALSGIDNALWDIKGKHFGVPAHTLMGGKLREKVRAYATGTYRVGDAPAANYILPEVDGYVQAGFQGMKLKIGFGVKEDVELIRQVRKTIGDSVELMIDANHGYDISEAIQLGRMVADLNIGWFEEPVPPEDIHRYAELRRSQPIPIAGGECEYTRWGFRDLLLANAVDILQPDVCVAGGLSECKKVVDMANAFGTRCVPHVWGTAIGMGAALQLLAVIPNNPLRFNATEPWLEFDRSEHPFREEVVRNFFKFSNGYVVIPDGPGLGFEVDEEAMARFRTSLTEIDGQDWSISRKSA